MIRAILFDFNGVLADDETPHVVCFQQALSEFGLLLTTEEYYRRHGASHSLWRHPQESVPVPPGHRESISPILKSDRLQTG